MRRLLRIKRISPGVVWYSYYRSETANLPVFGYVVHHPDYQVSELEQLSDYSANVDDQRDLFWECILVAEEQQSRYKLGYYSNNMYMRRMEYLIKFTRQHLFDITFKELIIE